jgi:hypothetical protein
VNDEPNYEVVALAIRDEDRPRFAAQEKMWKFRQRLRDNKKGRLSADAPSLLRAALAGAMSPPTTLIGLLRCGLTAFLSHDPVERQINNSRCQAWLAMRSVELASGAPRIPKCSVCMDRGFVIGTGEFCSQCQPVEPEPQ